MLRIREMRPAGQLKLQLIKKGDWIPPQLKRTPPKSEFGRYVFQCLEYLPAEMASELVERLSSITVIETSLALEVLRKETGVRENHGVVCRRVVTTAGVNYIAARLANSSPSNISLFNFHGLGTGPAGTPAVGDTTLVAELTTAYNPDNTRATGTQSNPSANVYRSVGLNTVDAGAAVVEHGIFTQAATGGGTLLDRFGFSVVNLANGDSLQSTFDFTINAGG